MPQSATEICNLAVSHLAISKEIQDLDTEKSKEAQACRRFYETARDKVLRDYPWPFATVIVTLELVTDFTQQATPPIPEWAFAYRMPSDCLRDRRILSGLRTDDRQSRVSYRIVPDGQGLLIYTNMQNAQLEYTQRVTEVGRFMPDFTMALSFLLAAYIAPRVTSVDQVELRKNTYLMYQVELINARANAANEEQPDEEPDSEFVRERG
jgi:hypothetical protein